MNWEMYKQLKEASRVMLEEERGYSEKEAYFMQRTRAHIQRVKDAAQKIVAVYPEFGGLISQVASHDESKFSEPERTPYIELTWQHAHDGWKSYKTPGTIDDGSINRATLHHVFTNAHHPEFYNKAKANIDSSNRDTAAVAFAVDAMPDIDLIHMVADWEAMSEELGTNTARQWFNSKRNTRWIFSPHQEELIDKLLRVFEGTSEKDLASPSHEKGDIT